jgi:hypothetical protein
MARQTNASAAALAAEPWPVRADKSVVRLKRGGKLRGVMLDHAGRPVAGARVYAAGARWFDLVDGEPDRMQGAGGTFGGASATTDAEGRFSVTSGGGAAEKIVVTASEGQMISVAAIPAGRKELKMTLPQPRGDDRAL